MPFKLLKINTCLPLAILVAVSATASGEVAVVTSHNNNDDATEDFAFRRVPTPLKTPTPGDFAVVDGEIDGNSGGPDKLNDGRMPTEDDQPDENFFFAAGTPGGRLRFDLRRIKTIQQIDTYSWHAGARGPQVYKLYGAPGTNADFNPSPKRGTNPAGCGWTFIASVDTRRINREPGGQYGVSISNSEEGTVGNYRYLLFDCSPSETNDAFGNTFYSEINVIGPGDDTNRVSSDTAPHNIKPYVAQTPDGKYEITIDTSRATNLTQWATNQLASALLEWYPKIVAYLPSKNFKAPSKFSIVLRPAAASRPQAAIASPPTPTGSKKN